MKDHLIAVTIRDLHDAIRAKRGNTIEAFKRLRKIHEHRLRISHNAGGGGRELARRRSDLVDLIIRELFDHVVSELGVKKNDLGIVVAAFGGYGRREMNPFSDVDIMFITASNEPDKIIEEIIHQIVIQLWDIGFKVSHSVRSIPQAIQQANEDMLTKTSMLESRYLIGNRSLLQEFRRRFSEECIREREVEYTEWRQKKHEELLKKYGSTVYMQEPNIKNGCGGLRDYQNLIWIACVQNGIQSTSKLVEQKFLRESERRKLESGYDFLLRVRTQMHYINGRPTDHLTLQLQGKVATAFNYPQKNILRRCEAFMRDYYQHTRDIHLTTEAALSRLSSSSSTRSTSLLSRISSKLREEKFDGLIRRDEGLYPESRDIFNQDPGRMMRVFLHAQTRKAPLSPELRDLINRRLNLVDRTFQYSRTNREVFFAILSHKGKVGPILREMHNSGFLGKYLPEFGALTCLVQHEFFHRYTADEHTLVCIEKLDSVLFTENPKFSTYRTLFQKLEDPAILYLSVLLHDIGKATNHPHHEEASAELAHKISRRLQLTRERRKMFINLVDNHTALSQIAQTRNLDDIATISEFAEIVKDPKTLDALMLLTLADGMGTSDDNWSDWKELLVWTLYRNTTNYFEYGPKAFEKPKEVLADLRQGVIAQLPKDFFEEAEAHFQYMPERYFRMFGVDAIREHLLLFRELFITTTAIENPAPLLLRWIEHPTQGHSEVWLCGWDRRPLLQNIAGSFLASQVNILSADVFARGDNLVFDIFRVCDTNRQAVSDERTKAMITKHLIAAMQSETFDFMPLLIKKPKIQFYKLSQEFDLPTKIVVENTAHPFYTILEIQTPDHIGLLYDLLQALNAAGLSIAISRITTELDVAIDTFYVTNANGSKITKPQEIQRLQKTLHQAAVAERSNSL